ncbi:GrpB family protein [Phyllobacterium zundukense]|uniref:GrpB family protein n=1 Tax=Phyllobacterium zundukense TaxID=1867719 RepID=UPI0029056F06|nr:GrpB family protein [Phyllobacterium zundukense]
MLPTDQSSTGRRRSIEVVDYDPSWPRQFEEIRAEVSSRLSGLVVEIHHIGSTAIPGLCAKPKIDVDIVLCSSLDIPEGIARLQASGTYTFHGDRYNDDMWVFTRGGGSPGQRLYLCAPGHQTHLHRILFRDIFAATPRLPLWSPEATASSRSNR